MKKSCVSGCAVTIALAVANVHAATAQLGATAIVTGSCAVVAPASVPSSSADVSVIHVSCSSGTPSSVVLAVNNPDAPAPGVPEAGVIATVSY